MANAEIAATSLLQLTTTIDGQSTTSLVPASLAAGTHALPSLAFDAASDTLFLVWQHGHDDASEILIASYHGGAWTDATVVSSSDAQRCDNLRVAAVHSDGLLVVNAVWWERAADAEMARLATLTIDGGQVTNIDRHSMNELYEQAVGEPPRVPKALADVDLELLRHPMIVPAHDTLDIIYGDLAAQTLRRVTVGLIPNIRIRIPGGRTGGPIGAPALQLAANSRISVIAPKDGDNLVLYHLDGDAMTYSLFSNGTWSAPRSITTTDVGTERATDALRRMVIER
ncbi:MAG: hypothetical protein JO197_03030 [Acidobacteria bacterium]|nr:hypothetical protein [Acidobacteriota bacterium]MBV9476644.1 hypothetical protein [Acidobacteriota bacterium]